MRNRDHGWPTHFGVGKYRTVSTVHLVIFQTWWGPIASLVTQGFGTFRSSHPERAPANWIRPSIVLTSSR